MKNSEHFNQKMLSLKNKMSADNDGLFTDTANLACAVETIDDALVFLHFLSENMSTLAPEAEFRNSPREVVECFMYQLKQEIDLDWAELDKNASLMGMLLAAFYMSLSAE